MKLHFTQLIKKIKPFWLIPVSFNQSRPSSPVCMDFSFLAIYLIVVGEKQKNKNGVNAAFQPCWCEMF